MTRHTRILVAALVVGMSLPACATSRDVDGPRSKNSAVATTTSLAAPVGPSTTLTTPDGVLFGSRVAIDHAMIFASTRARPNETKGVVYGSSFAEDWSLPREIVGSWDFHFGRDLDVNDHDVIATAADTRSGLFGNRTGDILVGTSPRSTIINTAPRLGLYARPGDDLGAAVALSDNYMAVSAPSVGRWTTPSPIVLVTSLTNASPTVTSVGPEGVATGETFGTALDLDDSTLVVGASGAMNGDGSVFVYTRSGDTWNLSQRLDGSNDEAFGSDVALVGSRMVVGAPGAAQGAVHICERTAGTWTCPTRIAHPDTAATGLRAFGASVDLASTADEFIVGAPWALGMSCCPGAAFTYILRDGSWNLGRSLQPTSPTNDDGFGNSVGLDDGVAVVGAPRASSGAGTVSIFGTPASGARAPRASVSFTSPAISESIAANVSLVGGAPIGFVGSLQAWDRTGNSWRSDFDAATRTFPGNWPDANSAYGSLTVFNDFGYDVVALTATISTPTPTTPPVTTSPSTLPSTTTPSSTAPPTTDSPTTTPSPTTNTLVTTSSPPRATVASASTVSPIATRVPFATTAQRAQSNSITSITPENATTQPPQSPGPNKSTSSFATALEATCRVGQPCSVEIPALLGAKNGSMRGAPPGLRYNLKISAISGTPRKRGIFKITVKAGANGRTGAATVTLAVK